MGIIPPVTRHIVFDTETSGLFDFKRPAEAEGQPRLASAAFLFLDSSFNIEREYHCFVKPDGWHMPEAASRVNGITQEMLRTNGVPLTNVLNAWNALLDQGCIFVAHNVDFDLKVMRGELRRRGLPDRFDETYSFCTMKASTPICKIPGPRGNKWPKLQEAYSFFFNEQFDNAHEALADARACAAVFKRLNELGHYREAA